MALSLFLAAMDISIVSTALFKIPSDLHDGSNLNWLPGAYLLANTGCLLTLAKASDRLGIKNVLVVCQFVFLVYSVACGAATTMIHLIILRAFHGIGGAGFYSLPFIVAIKAARPANVDKHTASVGAIFSLANLLGPLIGGAIASGTTWKWIFYLDVPVIVFALVITIVMCPMEQMPNAGTSKALRFDYLGSILSMAWIIPLILALQEDGAQWGWTSTEIFRWPCTLLLLFLLRSWYEKTCVAHSMKIDPILPLRIL